MINKITDLQQTLLSNQQKDLKKQLNPIVSCLEKIKTTLKGDEDIITKYITNYAPTIIRILHNLQDNLQIQKLAKYYNPSALPAPRKTIVENINLTKQSYMQMHQFQIQLEQSLEEMIQNQSQLTFTQQANEKQKNEIQQEIITQNKQLERAQNKIEQDLFLEENYIKLNQEIDKVKTQIQECENNINMLIQSQEKLNSQKKNLEEELINLKNEQNKISLQIKDATNNYQSNKQMIESISQKHKQELSNIINQFEIEQNLIISKVPKQNSKVILLIDEFNEKQYQEKALIEFLQKNLNQSDYSIYKYQSEDKFNFSNYSLFTHKFHLPKLLSSLTKALKTIIKDNQSNQSELNIILVGNSQKYEIPYGENFFEDIQKMLQILNVKKIRIKINIFDKQSSKSVFFNTFYNVFKQNGFDVSVTEDYQTLLSKIQKQDVNQNIKQQPNQQDINFNQAQQQINILQQQYSQKIKDQGQIQQDIDKYCEDILQEEKNIKNMKEEQSDLQQKQQILQSELQFFKEQYQNKKNYEIVKIQDLIKTLSNQQKDLQEQNTFILKVIPLIQDIITLVKQKIGEIKEFKLSLVLENKQLFSILWALSDNDKLLVLCFSLFLLNQEKYLQDESVEFLTSLLQITSQQAKEFFQSLEITFNQDREKNIVKISFKCKQNSQQYQQEENLDKLNKIITQESIKIINEIQTYSSLEEFEEHLNQHIKNLS